MIYSGRSKMQEARNKKLDVTALYQKKQEDRWEIYYCLNLFEIIDML